MTGEVVLAEADVKLGTLDEVISVGAGSDVALNDDEESVAVCSVVGIAIADYVEENGVVDATLDDVPE